MRKVAAVFHQAIMQAYWQQARSIGDKAVLKEIAEQAGLSTEHFDEVWQTRHSMRK